MVYQYSFVLYVHLIVVIHEGSDVHSIIATIMTSVEKSSLSSVSLMKEWLMLGILLFASFYGTFTFLLCSLGTCVTSYASNELTLYLSTIIYLSRVEKVTQSPSSFICS